MKSLAPEIARIVKVPPESCQFGMSNGSPSLVVRAIWFVFVGWWLTGLLLSVAWALNLTIVGLPIGIKLINFVPKALSLKEFDTSDADDFDMGTGSSGGSPSLVVRGAYFVLVGWWVSAIWMGLAYLVSLSIVGLPIGIKMYNKLPYVVSLYNP